MKYLFHKYVYNCKPNSLNISLIVTALDIFVCNYGIIVCVEKYSLKICIKLTSRCRAFLEEMMTAHWSRNSLICGNRKFITVFTTVLTDPAMSHLNLVRIHKHYFIKIHFKIIVLFKPRSPMQCLLYIYSKIKFGVHLLPLF
jgi:hypothetical protein